MIYIHRDDIMIMKMSTIVEVMISVIMRIVIMMIMMVMMIMEMLAIVEVMRMMHRYVTKVCHDWLERNYIDGNDDDDDDDNYDENDDEDNVKDCDTIFSLLTSFGKRDGKDPDSSDSSIQPT